MRNAYIVSYDISHPRRLRKVFKLMRGFGSHVQLSVFRCELSSSDRIRMIERIDSLVHHNEDQVLIIDLGPVDGRGDNCIEAIGRKLSTIAHAPVVV